MSPLGAASPTCDPAVSAARRSEGSGPDAVVSSDQRAEFRAELRGPGASGVRDRDVARGPRVRDLSAGGVLPRGTLTHDRSHDWGRETAGMTTDSVARQ
jgi:hypothetical protein